jgi:hypothetical protein
MSRGVHSLGVGPRRRSTSMAAPMIRSVRSWCSKVIISSPLIPDLWVTHSVSLPFLPSCLHHSLFCPCSLSECFMPFITVCGFVQPSTLSALFQ